VIEIIQSASAMPVRVDYTSARSLDAPYNVLSVDRVHDRIGWKPSLSLEEGVAALMSDLRSSLEVG
jgi:nucleoside-diphosphate-sugar epimerase